MIDQAYPNRLVHELRWSAVTQFSPLISEEQ